MKPFAAATLFAVTSMTLFAAMPHDRPAPLPLDRIELSAAQKEELRAIRIEARTERLKLTDALEALRDRTDERILAVLTDAQKAELKALRRDNPCPRENDRMPRVDASERR